MPSLSAVLKKRRPSNGTTSNSRKGPFLSRNEPTLLEVYDGDDNSHSSSVNVSVLSTKSHSQQLGNDNSNHSSSNRRSRSAPVIGFRETKVRFDLSNNSNNSTGGRGKATAAHSSSSSFSLPSSSPKNSSPVAANAKYADRCWFTAPELDAFKKDVVLLSKHLQKSNAATECNYRRVISSVFSVCGSVPHEVDTRKASILCPADRADLRKNLEKSLERMGLDRITVRVILEDGRQRRQRMAEELRILQQEHASSSSSSSWEERAEAIRQAMEPLSRPSRLFAREMGRALGASCKADATASKDPLRSSSLESLQ